MGNAIKKRKEKKGSHYSYLLFLEKKQNLNKKYCILTKFLFPILGLKKSSNGISKFEK